MHRVVVFVRDGLIPLEVGIPHRLFGQARSVRGSRLYEVVTATLIPGEVRTDTDFTINVPNGPELLAEADTVIIPASDEDYEPPTQGQLSPRLTKALSHVRPGTRMASICTGSFVLAAAGFLDGRRATTHWRSAADFRRMFPHIELDPNVLFTDCDNVLTSAGVASGLDLCLHMIRRDFGSAVANEVARGTVTPPHRDGGQAQYIDRLVPEPTAATTSAARAWAMERLDRAITLDDMAAVSGVSKRTFTRRFREETGMSPMQWLTEQRLHRARELLEQTDLPVDRVATASGLGSGTALRQLFASTMGVAPSAYRNTFRGRTPPEGSSDQPTIAV
ncbi:AraC family transcriptional regulator [Mycolicibacterium agri]|uniref:AraC family transcriptional regulator n=1 Tax=Mycolicibacterium agri TaxID=36811 RepID=A0A2A7MMU5_MYCAG|nr:AraC family transcriptional regulator [Mycolicibacterium agri]